MRNRCRSRRCPISHEMCIRDSSKIYVRQGTDAEPLFRGLAQEIAKVHLKQKKLTCCNPAFTAYSVAYVLCRKNQLSCETFRFDRMPAEFGGMDAKSARQELSTIRRVSNVMIGDMNRVLDTHDRKDVYKRQLCNREYFRQLPLSDG